MVNSKELIVNSGLSICICFTEALLDPVHSENNTRIRVKIIS